MTRSNVLVAAVVAVGVVVVAPACERGPSPEVAPQAQLLNDLAVFASGKSLAAEDEAKREREIASGALSLDGYIDELLKKPMGARLAKDLVISPSDVIKDRHPLPVHSILHTFKEDGGETVYYLRKKCDKQDFVRVKTWWAEGSEVLICADSYRPEVKGDTDGRTCGASMLAPRDADVCGCGPRLMYCTKDEEQFNKMQNEVADEVMLTAAYVVDHDRPVEDLYTMNETVRNGAAEALYRRARIAAGEPETLLPVTGFDAAGELRARVEQVPGQHAGVLSTPSLTYSSDALRGVMRNFGDYLWCAGVGSSRVTTDAILGLDVVDLRTGDGWKKLAMLNICTDCHARLDYGMQFFWGYPSSTMGVDFRPSGVRKGQGPLYIRDIDDERGTADLTPAGFAKLAVAQPEFGKCLTRKIVDHVFNGADHADDFTAVHDTFEKTHRVKAMLRTAMQRYAARGALWGPRDAAAAPSHPAAAAPVVVDGDKVTLTPKLRAMLDDKCLQCHDKDDPHDFNGTALPRDLLALMMDRVGFRQMPRTLAGLEESERVAFVDELAPLVFTQPDERAAAADYFANGLRARSVHSYRWAMLNVTARATGKTKDAFRPSGIEPAVAQSEMSYTPSVAVSAAAAAVHACHGKTAGELESCIERGTSPGTVIVGAVTHR